MQGSDRCMTSGRWRADVGKFPFWSCSLQKQKTSAGPSGFCRLSPASLPVSPHLLSPERLLPILEQYLGAYLTQGILLPHILSLLTKS